MPRTWEDRTTLFIGYKIDNDGLQSSSVRSYVSAIKRILMDDGYPWDDQKILLGSLTKACKLVNDRVMTRLPIHCNLLELILFKVKRIFNKDNQVYLQVMYCTLFTVAYYGLFRICELTKTASNHAVKAKDVHLAGNKNKLLLVLYTSKTHTRGMKPQKIKLVANVDEKTGAYRRKTFCPFLLTNLYLKMRGDYDNIFEQFFIFRDGSPVKAEHARSVLKNAIKQLGLDDSMYGFHSLRIGRTSDLIKFSYDLDSVRRMGRWRTNTIFKYFVGC